MSVGLSGRFFETTRGRIVQHLRRGARTVEELAQHLSLTDNAIRSHLATLERDGLVRREGVRRVLGAGKPATEYAIDPDAEPIFSRAYAPVLLAVLDEIAAQAPADQIESLMRGVGRRLAIAIGASKGGAYRNMNSRVQAAVSVLNSLGGEALSETTGGVGRIRGCGACPLGASVAEHPELCRAIEALLSEVVGSPVRSVCAHGERPRCGFELREVA